ncbi:MAG: DUF882 domain-containing protein [Geminicoccaceae bacterium]|nr:DUF882 domain-containing protein [Geminicoccaceae bacterium]
METEAAPIRIGRRALLARSPAIVAGGLIAASSASPALASPPTGPFPAGVPVPATRPASLLPPTRGVALVQPNTDERLDATYMRDGRADDGALAEINHLMRDWHTGDVIEIDQGLIDLLCTLQHYVGDGRPIEVFSAYRTKKTNDWLRRHGRATAKHSLHIEGMAVDMHIPGVRLRTVRDAARALNAGGVGYYPRSGFVHIDTGPVRYW